MTEYNSYSYSILSNLFTSDLIQKSVHGSLKLPSLNDGSYNWLFKRTISQSDTPVDYGRKVSFKINNHHYLDTNCIHYMHRLVGYKNFRLKVQFSNNSSLPVEINYKNIAKRIELRIGGCVIFNADDKIIPYLNFKKDRSSGFRFKLDKNGKYNFEIILPIITESGYIPFRFYHHIDSCVEFGIKEQISDSDFLELSKTKLIYDSIYSDKLNNESNLLDENKCYCDPITMLEYENRIIPTNSNYFKLNLNFYWWLNCFVFYFTNINDTSGSLIKNKLFETVELHTSGINFCQYNYKDLIEKDGYYTIYFTENRIDEYKDLHKLVSASKIHSLELCFNGLVKRDYEVKLHVHCISYNLLKHRSSMSGLSFIS